MIIFSIHAHPAVAGAILIRCGPDGNVILGRLLPGAFSPELRGYVAAASRLEAIAAELARKGCSLVDERGAEGVGNLPGNRPPYDPLPECSTCAMPVARERIDDLAECPACGSPWIPFRFERVRVDTQDETHSGIGQARFRETRAHLGLIPPDALDEAGAAARSVTCPWCNARPGIGCVSPATGTPLRLTSAHPSRYVAAGFPDARPRIDGEALATRKLPPDVLAGLLAAEEPGE